MAVIKRGFLRLSSYVAFFSALIIVFLFGKSFFTKTAHGSDDQSDVLRNSSHIDKNTPTLLAGSCGCCGCYSQGTYYSQGSYYSQGTYDITFRDDVDISETLDVTDALSKGSGSFVIDHPLDPENKLLYHSFVESPDVKNIYDGVAELDENGEVTIVLPEYFEALNDRYRYLYTPLDAAAPNLFIKSPITNNQFTIAGGPAGATISWQVTGIRKDPYILENPIIPEVEKGPDALVNKGEYLFEGYGDNDVVMEVQQNEVRSVKIFDVIKNAWSTFTNYWRALW